MSNAYIGGVVIPWDGFAAGGGGGSSGSAYPTGVEAAAQLGIVLAVGGQPRRSTLRLRQIREGVATPKGVSATAATARLKVVGREQLGLEGIAVPWGGICRAVTGHVWAKGGHEARAVVSGVAAETGTGAASGGGGCVTVAGAGSEAGSGEVQTRGYAIVRIPYGRGTTACCSQPRVHGILNPTDEEMVAMIVAVRKRRKKLLTAAKNTGNVATVSGHSL